METSRLEPEITICKIAVLPIKLCPLFIIIYYPRNDLNVHDIKPAKLKFALSTNSSTRIFIFSYMIYIYIYIYILKIYIYVYIHYILYIKARVIRTLISTVMSSLLYQLSYGPYII